MNRMRMLEELKKIEGKKIIEQYQILFSLIKLFEDQPDFVTFFAVLSEKLTEIQTVTTKLYELAIIDDESREQFIKLLLELINLLEDLWFCVEINQGRELRLQENCTEAERVINHTSSNTFVMQGINNGLTPFIYMFTDPFVYFKNIKYDLAKIARIYNEEVAAQLDPERVKSLNLVEILRAEYAKLMSEVRLMFNFSNQEP